MDSAILDPFRLDALFRAFRLSAKKSDMSATGRAGNIDGFSEIFFSGAARPDGTYGLSGTELNSIKRLSSAQGRGFLKTLSSVREFFDVLENEAVLLSNAASLYSCLAESDGYTGPKRFMLYITNNINTRFLLDSERSHILGYISQDPVQALYHAFRHAYLHLESVTGIAVASQYEAVQTLYPGAEARLRICEELAPYNVDACTEYADWLNDECADKLSALKYYSMHTDSNLCLWHTANKLRQSCEEPGFILPASELRAVTRKTRKLLEKSRKGYTAAQLGELDGIIPAGGSAALKLAYELFFSIANSPEPFCKAFTSLAQMLDTGEVSFADSIYTSRLSREYYELAISAGDVMPLLNISNHLASRFANQLIRPLRTAADELTPDELQTMLRYNTLAMNLGLRSCRFSALRIGLCTALASGGSPDREALYASLKDLEHEDLSLPAGVSRVFINRSDYWALRGETSPDPDEKIACLEKALQIETEKSYDHIPQLAFYLADLYESRSDGASRERGAQLISRYYSDLCTDERYRVRAKELLMSLA